MLYFHQYIIYITSLLIFRYEFARLLSPTSQTYKGCLLYVLLGVSGLKYKYCDSENIVKNGSVRGKQRFLCKTCNHQFLDNGYLPKMKFRHEVVAQALTWYFDELSLFKVKRAIEETYGVHVSKLTIYNWVLRFSRLVSEYLNETIRLDYRGSWQVDETQIKCRSDMKAHDTLKWIWQVIDEDSRFILAIHLSENRDSKEAIRALRKSLWERYKDRRPKHIRGLGIRSGATNKVERLHETLKDRLKPLRDLKNSETAKTILEGWKVHYNFVKKHMSIGNKRPAEVLGINLPNNWKDLIKQAIINNL